MRIAVLGTGSVGTTVGRRLVELGHDVALGSRTADHPAAVRWAADAADLPGTARHGVFAAAAAGAELVVNATAGSGSVAALTSLDPVDVDGTVVLDIANPLDSSRGMPPVVQGDGHDSLAERIQAALPRARVVKALNTMSAAVMVDPGSVAGRHTVFVSGDDAAAKAVVRDLLVEIGWPERDVLDLGGLDTARGTEEFLPLWLRLWGALGTTTFNIAVVTGD